MNYFIQKKIPFYYLYDDKGSELFDQITRSSEYYPYVKEEEILIKNISDITQIDDDQITEGITLVELGAGYSKKTEIILKTLLTQFKNVTYIPVDVSESACKISFQKYCKISGLEILPFVGTYDEYLDAKNSYMNRTIYLWLGSSIGNLDTEEQISILKKLESVMGYRDFLLIGFDTVYKDISIIEKAYNDDKGVTAEFIINILTHLKRKYNLKLEEKDFGYLPIWNHKLQRVEMYLECLRDTKVADLDSLQMDLEIKKGEKIFVEASHKFSLETVLNSSMISNLMVHRTWMSEDKYFMMTKFTKSIKPVFELTDHIFQNIIGYANLHLQPISLRNPFIFYFGHIYTFYDIKIFSLCKDDQFYELFERGKDPLVNNPENCHRHSKIKEEYPNLEEILEYVKNIKEKVLDYLSKKGYTYNLMLCFEHEMMHQETLLYMVRISDFLFPITLPKIKYIPPIKKIITIPKRKIIQGTNETFVWDNESPVNIIEVESFKIDNLPITWNDIKKFLLENPNLLDKIININSKNQIRISSSQWIEYDEGMHLPAWVSLKIAQSYVEWINEKGVKCRIMTEEEFDSMASTLKSTRKGNSDFINYHAMPIGFYKDYSDDGVGELFGNGWELTMTKFRPFPGFKPMENYLEYSTDFFTDHHYVIKGAGPFTKSSICRKSFRNWYQINYPFHTSKFRLVYY